MVYTADLLSRPFAPAPHALVPSAPRRDTQSSRRVGKRSERPAPPLPLQHPAPGVPSAWAWDQEARGPHWPPTGRGAPHGDPRATTWGRRAPSTALLAKGMALHHSQHLVPLPKASKPGAQDTTAETRVSQTSTWKPKSDPAGSLRPQCELKPFPSHTARWHARDRGSKWDQDNILQTVVCSELLRYFSTKIFQY